MGSGHGQFTGYRLEVRVAAHGGTVYDCGGFPVTKEWQTVPVTTVSSLDWITSFRSELWTWCAHARELGLLDYEVAHGIAAQFHAAFRQANWALEFRLTRHRVEWSYEEKASGVSEAFSFGKMEKAEQFTEEQPATPASGGKEGTR